MNSRTENSVAGPNKLLHSLVITDRVFRGHHRVGPSVIEQELSASSLESTQIRIDGFDTWKLRSRLFHGIRRVERAHIKAGPCEHPIGPNSRRTGFAGEMRYEPHPASLPRGQPGNIRFPSALRSGPSYKVWTMPASESVRHDAVSALDLQSNAWGSNEHFLGSPMIPSASPSCCHMRRVRPSTALRALKPGTRDRLPGELCASSPRSLR